MTSLTTRKQPWALRLASGRLSNSFLSNAKQSREEREAFAALNYKTDRDYHLETERQALETIRNLGAVNIPLLIDDYKQVASLVAKDLGWYLVYEVIMTVKENLKLHSVTMDFTESKNELYHFAIKVYLGRAISHHIFHDRPVELAEKISHEAMEYFALKTPVAPTYQLATYLNYLESWAGEHPDWTCSSPQAFDDLEIEVSVE
ncbi:hypothetical protein IM774_09600 [Erysipelotrichaceae bacterium RD49]|nr:hypothetical protein [Erysipelotrichaceae bacterium RD49]